MDKLKEFNRNKEIENIERKIHKQFLTPLDKVQFLWLLLSFCTRLAFTIGSEALEKHHENKKIISMDSFVLAYNALDPNQRASYKLRLEKNFKNLNIFLVIIKMR